MIQMNEFLSSVLPSRGVYFAVYKGEGGFVHCPCQTVDELAARLADIDNRRKDAYFACSSYLQESYTDQSGKVRRRTSENAAFARSFWLDIDCGEDKAIGGVGYTTVKQATKALLAFCLACSVPKPTTVVSGGGLHCYWVLTDEIRKDMWLPIAGMLKELTVSCPAQLLADPARTSDIASILRPVETTNWKPVREGAKVLLVHKMAPIGFYLFKNAVEKAHRLHCSSDQPAAQVTEHSSQLRNLGTDILNVPPLNELSEQLSHINPDLPRGEWWPIVAAIADAYGENGRILAREWSSGGLRAEKSQKFELKEFEKQYADALNRKDHAGKKTTVATIRYMARQAGWKDGEGSIANVTDWPQPKEIKAALPPVPEFDPTMMPDVFQAYVADAAELMQAPMDYIAIPLMTAAAATLGNDWAIAPKARDTSWLVTPVLWGGIVGRPGMKKSPAMDKGLCHLQSIEDEMEKAHQLDVQKFQTDKIVYDAAATTAKAAAKAGRSIPILPPEPKAPQPERLVVNDSTYQKLTDILQWCPRGLLVVKDELVGLLEQLASEGQEGARAFYLQAWNGNSQYKVDRVGRGSLVIKRLAIWLVGGIQPGKLQAYVRQAVLGGNGDDGLLQRFQLIVWPDVSSGWLNVDRHPDVAALNAVHDTFQYLRSLSPSAIGARTWLGGGPAYLHFTTEAQAQYDAIRTTLEIALRKGERHPALESHFAKYPSLLATLALVIHLIDRGTGPVTLSALEKAAKWVIYLGAHAKRVYSVATNGAAHSAKALAEKIKNGQLQDGFSAREVHRKQWSYLTTLHDVREAIEWLADAEWLKEVDNRAGTSGRFTYAINPLALGQPSVLSVRGAGNSGTKKRGNSSEKCVPLTDNTDSTRHHQ